MPYKVPFSLVHILSKIPWHVFSIYFHPRYVVTYSNWHIQKCKFMAIDVLGIELPFPAPAVETTKDPLVAAFCFWATKVLLVTNTSFLVYKLRARAHFQATMRALCGMSLIAIGQQCRQVVHLRCWVPKIFVLGGDSRHMLCVLAPVLMLLYISSAN
jgi:uncharacterized membrane protein YesL